MAKKANITQEQANEAVRKHQEKFDYAVFIGRFQPFHNAQRVVVDRALKIAKRVIILVGSSNVSRSFHNPFTYEERVNFIEANYPSEFLNQRIVTAPIGDYTYDNDAWVEAVQETVANVVRSFSPRAWEDKGVWDKAHLGTNKVVLIGRNKDNSSFYLKLFPNWDSHDIFEESVALINATDIRQRYFNNGGLEFANEDKITVETFNLLAKFRNTDEYADVLGEHIYCEKYKEPYKVLPYTPTFNTVDVVIKCSDHILLVTRKARPGKGLLVLPGGFLEPNETLLESAIREVFEETKIKLSKADLLQSLKHNQSFDDPHRDPRGRFITQAFFFDLGNRIDFPVVKGGSDAAKAQWIPLAELRANELFADHYFIIRSMLKQA